MAPEDELEKIGLPKEGKLVYELANGETVEYELGFARVAFMGQETVSQVIFGQRSRTDLGRGRAGKPWVHRGPHHQAA